MREPTRIIAIRHGETAWNVASRLQGQLDVPLNERGQAQARLTAQSLLEDRPDVLYSSDLSRARDTACAISEALDLPLETHASLRERHFGIWQGQTYAEIEQHWPDLSELWRRRLPEFGPEGGETLQAFSDRCVAAFAALAAPHEGQTVVIVTHGGVLDCLYRAASHMALNAPRTWELPNTGINRLLYTGEGFTVVGWADTQHLEAQALDEASDGATQAV
ncbi:histidine phosphatase family protein [Ideonella paludis]|uniref:Histidine phosphatase family protein n=1 Tax=Ideonella paludis TaxID=1233411 RepID=A0ABS5DZZ5_9BURK|nr:histidine phosphatase family protein [Ideonella paludis]MBQ0936629.1 histidine phosphatase family protein [Ideonella paludis]